MTIKGCPNAFVGVTVENISKEADMVEAWSIERLPSYR